MAPIFGFCDHRLSSLSMQFQWKDKLVQLFGDCSSISEQINDYPELHLEDKVIFPRLSNVTPTPISKNLIDKEGTEMAEMSSQLT